MSLSVAVPSTPTEFLTVSTMTKSLGRQNVASNVNVVYLKSLRSVAAKRMFLH
jgi:hypothetical protein